MIGLDCLSQSVGEAPVQRGEGSLPSKHPPEPSRADAKTGEDEALLTNLGKGIGAGEGHREALLLVRWPAAAGSAGLCN